MRAGAAPILRAFGDMVDAATSSGPMTSRAFPDLADTFPNPALGHSTHTFMSAAVCRVHDRLMSIKPGAAADLPSDVDSQPSVHHLQKWISERVAEAKSARLLADVLGNRSKAQCLSHCSDPYTFSALPTCPELTLSNSLLPLAIVRRLLLPTTACSCEAH